MREPFYVLRSTRTTNGCTHVTTYSIERVGGGTVCYCDDPSWAYRIVDLLNADELQVAGK